MVRVLVLAVIAIVVCWSPSGSQAAEIFVSPGILDGGVDFQDSSLDVSDADFNGTGGQLSVGIVDQHARWYGTLGRMTLKYGDLTLVTFGADYLFGHGHATRTYFGLSGGYGRLDWDRNPPFDEDRNANFDGEYAGKAMIGLQVGILMEFDRHWQLDIGARGYYTRMRSEGFVQEHGMARHRIETLGFMNASVIYRF